MPESRRRKKKPSARAVGPPAAAGAGSAATVKTPGKKAARAQSPAWFGWTLLGLFVVGIAWLLVYYFSDGTALGMGAIGGWNVAIGFGFILGGLGLATRWK